MEGLKDGRTKGRRKDREFFLSHLDPTGLLENVEVTHVAAVLVVPLHPTEDGPVAAAHKQTLITRTHQPLVTQLHVTTFN